MQTQSNAPSTTPQAMTLQRLRDAVKGRGEIETDSELLSRIVAAARHDQSSPQASSGNYDRVHNRHNR